MTDNEKEYFKKISGTKLFDALFYESFGLALLITLVQNLLTSVDIF